MRPFRAILMVNLPPRQIGPFQSQCLVLGVPDEKEGGLSLVGPDRPVPLGGRPFS